MFDIALVGLSGGGKTLLGTSLTAEFRKRGYSVCAVKSMREHDFDEEREGTDTWRYARAGAGTVVALARNGIRNARTGERTEVLDDTAEDLRINEGGDPDEGAVVVVCLKRAEDINEVWRTRSPFPEPLAFSGEIANEMTHFLGKPVYHPTKDAAALADLLIAEREGRLGLREHLDGELL